MISYHLETLTDQELNSLYSRDLIYTKQTNLSAELEALHESDVAAAMKFTNFNFNFN